MSYEKLKRQIETARVAIQAQTGQLPNMAVISDATAKQLCGPDAIGGVYVRCADGTFTRLDDNEIDL